MRRKEFSAKTKLAIWERASGHCEICTRKLYPGDIHYDHIVPCANGGEPVLSNGALLCRSCHGRKTYRQDIPAVAKGKRIRRKHIGIGKRTTFRGWRRFDGRIVHADDHEGEIEFRRKDVSRRGGVTITRKP